MQLARVPQGFRGTVHPLPIGARLSPAMRVAQVLGAGATSIVYAVKHAHFADEVAVKVVRLPSGDPGEAMGSLLAEARVYATLTDPRVPRVYYVDQLDDGSPCIVMECVVGRTVHAHLSRGAVSPLAAASLLVELLEILAHVHARGVLHRDVKPANLVLSRRSGDRMRLYLLDFGIGKFAHPSAGVSAPFDRAMAGTQSYMAPELLMGGQPSVRSDLYAAGVVLHQALTGALPYAGQSELVLSATAVRLGSGMSRVPTAPEDPALPPPLARVVARALRRDPAARFASANAMKRALVRALWEA